MNKVAHVFLTASLFAILTMLTAIAWSQHTATTPEPPAIHCNGN